MPRGFPLLSGLQRPVVADHETQQLGRAALKEAKPFATLVGGYLFFLVIVGVFHVALAGEHRALFSAATGGVFLLVGASAVYAIGVWSVGRIGRVRSDREGGRADEGDGLENR